MLRLLAEGLPNKAIAARLHLSEKTVKSHVSSVLAKLGVADRTQAALRAVRDGYVGELTEQLGQPLAAVAEDPPSGRDRPAAAGRRPGSGRRPRSS